MTPMRQIFVGIFVDKVPDKARDKAWVAGDSPPWDEDNSLWNGPAPFLGGDKAGGLRYRLPVTFEVVREIGVKD
jgi:hypothetical protein